MADVNGVNLEPISSRPQLTSAQTPPPSQPATTSTNSDFPATSLVESGLTKRPRDARLLHMVLANLGVTSYQERVPLQLMDFAYRYTSSTLQDSLHLTSESHGGTAPGAGAGRGTANNSDMSSITLSSLRLSIASRTHYQFNPNLPKEFYQEMAQDRNRVALPAVGKDWGVRLPPERYCLTGVGWGLKEEWDSEGEGEDRDGGQGGDEIMSENVGGEGNGEEGEEGDERMEDLFGEQVDVANEDRDMGDD
ncbi:Transcription initiation factor TFIID subunit 9 [Toensbergia leucococca]|nr:Transcription initiation factor TFIID subunit 9 [Toensbergia leucococca]